MPGATLGDLFVLLFSLIFFFRVHVASRLHLGLVVIYSFQFFFVSSLPLTPSPHLLRFPFPISIPLLPFHSIFSLLFILVIFVVPLLWTGCTYRLPVLYSYRPPSPPHASILAIPFLLLFSRIHSSPLSPPPPQYAFLPLHPQHLFIYTLFLLSSFLHIHPHPIPLPPSSHFFCPLFSNYAPSVLCCIYVL
jgi:hypothetical protein